MEVPFVSHRNPPNLIAIALAMLLLSCAAVTFADEAPKLDRVGLMPTSGDTNTPFTFMIVYHGPASPASHNLYLDSKCYVMDYAGAAPLSGVMYVYHTRLTAGTHKYRFRFKTGTQELLMPGPDANGWYTSLKVADIPTFTVSGTVTCEGKPLSGVGIKLTKQGAASIGARTDSQGRYTAKGAGPGTWSVTPSMTGFTFDPPARGVTVPPSGTNCDFTATRLPRTGRSS
jgi:hypothetical protein